MRISTDSRSSRGRSTSGWAPSTDRALGWKVGTMAGRRNFRSVEGAVAALSTGGLRGRDLEAHAGGPVHALQEAFDTEGGRAHHADIDGLTLLAGTEHEWLGAFHGSRVGVEGGHDGGAAQLPIGRRRRCRSLHWWPAWERSGSARRRARSRPPGGLRYRRRASAPCGYRRTHAPRGDGARVAGRLPRIARWGGRWARWRGGATSDR